MISSRRRRRLWIVGAIAVLIAGIALVSFSLNEPVRRSMEREINRRLTGYTVTVHALHVHPWLVSLELLDSSISQDANPDPPVARIRSLTASLQWRALLHGRVVADILFDQPALYVNVKNFSAEVTSDVALKDRGWQEALEAVALDLKIDRFRVRDGDVTYVDRGPFKPLHLSRVNLTAENIRNIKSKERTYPSNIHLEAVVFDAGTLWLDGHADFLAEPHVGVQAAVQLAQVELDYFKPITNRYNLAVTKGTLSLAGNVEYAPTVTRLVLERVLVQGVQLEYVHSPRTADVEQARTQQTVQAAKQVANKSSVELRIDRLDITKSSFGFVNQAATPPYRVVLSDTDLRIGNLSNQRGQGTAVARIKGRLMGSGDTQVTATVAPRTGGADVDMTAQVERVDMARMSDLVRAYGGVDVAAGELSVYSELQVKDGTIRGYVKPLFRGVKVGDAEGAQQPKGVRRRVYEATLGAVAKILENRPRKEVATVVTISGRTDHLQVSTWETVRHLLQNAFFKAILPGFEAERSPKPKPPVPDSTSVKPPQDPAKDQTPQPVPSPGSG